MNTFFASAAGGNVQRTSITKKLKTGLWFVAKILISVTLLVYATRSIELNTFAMEMRALDLRYFCLGIMQLSLIPLLGGVRWKIALRALGSGISLGSSVRIFWLGMMFSQILPSTSGGDAARVVMAWRGGVPLVCSAHSVVLERIVMLLVMIGVVALVQVCGGVPQLPFPGANLLIPVMLTGAIAGCVFLSVADSLFAALPPIKPLRMLAELAADTRKILAAPVLARMTAVSLLTQFNLAVATLWLGQSLGLQLHLLDYLFYISLVTLVTSLPLSIGGWGVREGALVTMFGTVGVPAHGALAFSILYGLSVAFISLGALPFLSLRRSVIKKDDTMGDSPGERAGELSCQSDVRN